MNEQEEFWAGDFGNHYIERNKKGISANTALFTKIFNNTIHCESIIELGANIGNNLVAIQNVLPDADLTGIEINPKAYEQLEKLPGINSFHGSILDFKSEKQYDLSFTKGVLIHINPESLKNVYKLLYESSRKYVLVCEYYNPTPVDIPYRGHSNRLFKRDFAGDIRELYPNLELIDYGFVYHKDPNFPQDDITWFLMQK